MPVYPVTRHILLQEASGFVGRSSTVKLLNFFRLKCGLKKVWLTIGIYTVEYQYDHNQKRMRESRIAIYANARKIYDGIIGNEQVV